MGTEVIDGHEPGGGLLEGGHAPTISCERRAPGRNTGPIAKGRGIQGSGPLEDRYRYLSLDAKVEKVRDGGQVVRERLVVAHAVHETRWSEVSASTSVTRYVLD